MNNCVAIIPARGGSKRIKGKNIRSFHGKPIIAYSIEQALKSDMFDQVIVSTDSEEIKTIALSYGAQVPFLRSNENADDHASIYDVIKEVHEKLDTQFEYTCCLFATAPLLQLATLKEAVEVIADENIDCAFTVTPYKYPIQRALRIKNGRLGMIQEEHLKTRSQDLDQCYHDAGMMYFYKTSEYLRTKSVFKMRSHGIVLAESLVQDIDTEEDWKMAELKYSLLKG